MKRILGLFILLAAQLTVTGQINLSDYIDGLNTYYTGVDTQYQLHNEIKTLQEETAYINKLYPFQTNQVNGSAQLIEFYDTLQPQPQVDFPFYISWGNGSNYYKAQKLSFKLNQDTGYTFCYKNLAINNNAKTAYIIIPGSGFNQATGVAIYNPANYHNTVCTIAQSCQQYGDVYTYARPNDDFAALWTTVSPGVRRKMGYTALTSKTNLNNKNWAANCYIQINALVKYLKTKYKKVVVLGLSSGAWGAMFTSLQTEPDAALMASGYSISFHDLTYTYGPDQMHYDGLFSGHPIDSVRSKIRKMNTQFLFSYGTNDAVTHMQDEHDNHTTENYFNTPSAPGNTSYFYNYSLHRFPCEAIDTFFTRIEQMPKVSIEQNNTCTSDSLVLKLRFTGTPPYQGMLYRDDMPYQTFSALQDSTTIIVYDEGNYQIKNLLDSNQVDGFKSNIFTYNKISKLIVGTAQQQYLCATDSTQITLPLNGTAPYKAYLEHNNQTDTLWFNNNAQFNVANGTYTIQQISDLNECIWNSGQSINVSNQAINALIDAPIYDCDSNKNKISIHLNGNGPWQINYFKSGTPFSIFQTDTIHTYWFENGQYLFNEISDNTGCNFYNNQYVNLSGTPIQTSISSPIYNCDSNKIGIHINSQGNSPYHLYYSKNNTLQQENWQGNSHNFYLTNGAYQLAYIQDVTGCVDSFNTSYLFQYDSLDVYFDVPYYDCDSNKTALTIHTKGNGPWTISYAYNGQNQIATIFDTTTTWYLTNGQYLFQNIEDSTGCSKNINQVFNFQYQALSWNITQQAFDCDSNLYKTQWAFTGNGPWTIQYTLNGGTVLSKTFTSASSNWYLSNGQYQIINITDITSCTQSINVPLTLNFNPISINTLTPIYDCDSNKTKINFSLQGNSPWVLNYTVNGLAQQMVFTQANTDVFFTNGLYQFIDVVDNTGCMASINQSFSFQYQALSWNITQQAFDCDSNLYKTQWAFTGNGPWTIQYTLNGGTVLSKTFTSASSNWYLSNGQYQIINITDITSCTQSINVPLTLNFNPISINTLTPIYNCDSNKTKINFSLQGNSPWVLNYTLNGLAQQMVFTQANTDVFFTNGLYQFIDVVDNTSCMASINQSFSFQYQALSWNITQQAFDCDSNLYKTQWAFTGNGPWTIQYTLNGGTVLSKTFTSASSNWYLSNGQYQIINITDITSCTQSINVPLTLNFNPIGINTLNPVYNCDSNKTKINFALQGNGPWVLNYTLNGLAQQMVFTQANTDVFFANGLYQFIDVVDNTGCMASINQSFNFQYQALSWNITQQAFDCDSNLYKTQWAFTGNGPWTLTYELIGGFLYTQTYTNSNATLYLPNGQWQMLSVSDNTGCVQAINIPITVNYTPLSVITSIPQYDCDSNKMQVSFSVQGNAPFVFQVNQLNNNNTQWLNTLQNNPSFWWGNGQYLIQQVTDATGCIKSINQYVNNTIQPLSYQALPKQFNCDSQKVRFPFTWQGNAPWIVSYRNLNNGLIYTQIDSVSNSSLWLASGQYALLSLSDAYCTIPLQDTLLVNFPNLNVQLTTPGILCDSNMARMELTVQAGLAPMFLHYVYNGVPDSMPISVGLQTKLLPNGSYYFNEVRDSAQCAVNINKSYTANYIPLQWYPWTNQYNCLSNINNISFNMAGANNTTLYYTRNGNPNTLLLNAGINNIQWNKAQYQLAYIRDTAQCSLVIDTTFTITDEPIAFEVSDLKPICEDKVHEYTFKVKGKAPWEITYNYDNATRTISLNDTTNRWTCDPGKYDFIKITDANGCELASTRIDTLPNFIPNNPILSTNYQTLQVEPKNFPITWWFNQQAMDSTLYNGIEIRHRGEGSYYASITDDAKCVWLSNIVDLEFDNPLTLYPNPTSDQIALLTQDNFGTNWRWQISNALGQNMASGQVIQPLEIINVKTWPSGIYTVIITYQNSPNRRIIRFVKK